MVTKDGSIVEIEIDNPQNRCLFFGPLQRRIRGGFDYHRVAERNGLGMLELFPDPIPGQRLRVNVDTGEAGIVEPLRDPAHAVTAEKIEKQLERRIPQDESFEGVDVPTWLYWMMRAVQGGHARLTQGEIPKQIDGKPQKSFFSAPVIDSNDRLADALDRQTEVFAELIKSINRRP